MQKISFGSKVCTLGGRGGTFLDRGRSRGNDLPKDLSDLSRRYRSRNRCQSLLIDNIVSGLSNSQQAFVLAFFIRHAVPLSGSPISWRGTFCKTGQDDSHSWTSRHSTLHSPDLAAATLPREVGFFPNNRRIESSNSHRKQTSRHSFQRFPPFLG